MSTHKLRTEAFSDLYNFLRRKRREMNQITVLQIAVHTKLDAKTEIVCLSTYVSTIPLLSHLRFVQS